jgi:serine/threonine protein kinase
MNLLYGGANNKIVIRHKGTNVQITSLPFYRDTDYVDRNILTLPLVQTMGESDKQVVEQLISEAQDKKRALLEISVEEKKDKDNIDPPLPSMKEQHQKLLQQKQEIEKANKIMSDEILQFLLQYFIANFHIVIDGIHNYDFYSYVSMGGQGIVFRIVKSNTGERHIIKFAIHYNCDEIKHEAETLEKYYKDHGIPTTFRSYKPLLYHDGADDTVQPVDKSAMDTRSDTTIDVRNMCFAIYEDVGNEDLLTFIRRCNTLGASNPLSSESIGASNLSSQELVDRIRMIPHILLQIALQLDYYKFYRHNDIRLENIVVDIGDVEQGDLMGQDEPVGPKKPIYRGTLLELVRVTIIDFGKFTALNVLNFSLAYIASPEALEQEFIDKQSSDLIGFCWVAIDLLTLSQTDYTIMEKILIKRVLSNEQNKKILAHVISTHDQLKRKALLFIYQLLMHNSPLNSQMSKIFDGMIIDKKITFNNLCELILNYKKYIILQILFQSDEKKYKSFITDLLSLLASIDSRPNIQQLKFTLKEFVKTISP